MPSAPPETPARRTRLFRTVEWGAVVAMAIAGVAMLHGRTISSGFTQLPGDLGDTRFNLLILEHGYRHLRGDALERDFWSPGWEFFPHPNTLAYSDNFAGDLPLYAPFRVLGLDAPQAFCAWIVLCSLLNFAAALLLGRSLGLSRLGAGAAASLFAFAMPRSQQLNHIQLLPQFWTPLCFFALAASWRSWHSQRIRPARLWAAAGVACVVGQLAAGIYLGDYLLLGLLGLALVGAVELARHPSSRGELVAFARATGAAWIASAAVGAAVLFPIAQAYGRAHRELGGRNYDEVVPMLPRLASYLVPHPGSLLYGWLNPMQAGLPLPWEHTMFAGFVPLLALVWLLVASRRGSLPVSVWIAVATVTGWIFAFLATLWLGSYHGGNMSLWWLIRMLPGLDALRAVTRVAMLEILPAGLAVGIGVTALQRAGRPWQVALAWLLALTPLLENWSRCPADVSRDEIVARAKNISSRVPANCDVFFWRGGNDPSFVTQLDATWASMEMGKPTANGYSGHEPPRWGLGDPRSVTSARVNAWLTREGATGLVSCLPQ